MYQKQKEEKPIMYDTSQSILLTHSYPQEESRKKPPSIRDIKETFKLFLEFHLPIPDLFSESNNDFKSILSYFPTYYSLEIYRRTYITNQLSLLQEESQC